MELIQHRTMDEERALYHLTDGIVEHCTFAGPADGESALKEARNVTVRHCAFSLRYPFWHTEGFTVEYCTLDEGVRASLWYAADGTIRHTTVSGVKCLRECRNISFEHCTVVSEEFGWRCRNVDLSHTAVTSQYFLFETKGGNITDLTLKGKYSFQYTEDLTVTDSVLDTKDAFWHSKNVTVKNCTVKGEYLGWYSEGLTLINCHIVGTQPLCYCKNLTLVDCTMEGTDLSFEYSSVNATVKGHVDSIKNPAEGKIVVDSVGEIILEQSVMETNCEIVVNSQTEMV